MKEEMAKLENSNPINVQKLNSKEEVFDNAKKPFDIRSKIIKEFEDGIFPLSKENLHKEQDKEEKEEEKKRRKRRNNS